MEQTTNREFRIRRRIDKSGDNSVITLFFEILAVFGIVWVGLFILPLFLGSRSAGLRKDEGFGNFILDLYNHPVKYYLALTIIAVTSTIAYLTAQLMSKKIIVIIVDGAQLKCIITNRIGSYYKRKYVNLGDINTELKKTSNNELKGITFYNKDKKVGYFEFVSLKNPSESEKELIAVFKSK